jgi:predicted PhzF superfamily epimerase YddE/YHI9
MRQWMIDAFASGPFRGNPACVVEPFEAWPEAARMQALAAENNQAETAFLLKGDTAARFCLLWFTPTTEVPLCGHATLASAHALFAELGVDARELTFRTHSGKLTVRREGQGYQMDFPLTRPRRIDPPPGLAAALRVRPKEVWAAQYLIAVLEDEDQVRALDPDISALKPIATAQTQRPGNVGVAAIADAGKPYDVVDRFFAPGSGIPEDPTTGSMHCILAPLFADKLGRERLSFHQAYPGRGGDLVCELAGERVLISGRAVTIAESRLRFGL